MCYKLYSCGVKTRFESIITDIENGTFGLCDALYAILIDEEEIALKLVSKDSLIGSLILKDYNMAREYLASKQANTDLVPLYISIIEGNEEEFNKHMEERIRLLRRQAKIALQFIDILGLAIIKLAQKRGMTCNVNVAELPKELLEDTTIDHDKWQLPIPECVQKLLEN